MVVPEILAPAGSMDAFKAAIANRADAVYLGGQMYNARQSAANFDEQEIANAVRIAHRYKAKVYVTVNILLNNGEIEEAARYLKFLYNAGVDGVIIQDLGLLYLAREAVPHLKLHGSTQMTIHNLPGTQFFAERGLERVVLARELSLEDIATIRQGSNVELEVFVHGALCICYSGRCLMSSMIGGRSGNRGRCAQPCRLPYQLIQSNGESIQTAGDYLLSPKDLCAIDILPELVASGVHSLKFEGRMKRPEYVATVIRIYREALERCLADPENFKATTEEKKQLAQVFNRDFSEAYYRGNPKGDLISYQRPSNRGVYLGRIVSLDSEIGLATVKLAESLSLGDGIEFWVSKGGRTGITVKEINLDGESVTYAPAYSQIAIEAPFQARVGERIFKTHDALLVEKAQASFQGELLLAKTPVSMKITGTLGEPLQLLVEDEKGNSGSSQTKFLAEEAKNRSLTRVVLEEQLGRLGNTNFVLGELKLDLPGNLMVPFSELNRLRREGIADLEKAIKQTESRPLDKKRFYGVVASLKARNMFREEKIPQLAVAVGDPQSVTAAAGAGADYIYIIGEHFRSKRWVRDEYIRPIELAKEKGVKIYYALPSLWLESNVKVMEKIKVEIEALPLDGLMVGNPGSLKWVRSRLKELPIVLDHPFNLMNDLSIQLVAEEGIQGITLSPELNFQEIASMRILSGLEFEGLVHGAIPLMVSEHCTVGSTAGHNLGDKTCSKPCVTEKFGLKDRKNYVFPVEMDQFCRMHIFNSQELCLIDFLPKFAELGYHRVRIEAGKDTADYVKQVTTIYRRALDDLEQGQVAQLDNLKDELERFSLSGLTKGHYFRGV